MTDLELKQSMDLPKKTSRPTPPLPGPKYAPP